jgi:Xaa-Pro dipeptidase
VSSTSSGTPVAIPQPDEVVNRAEEVRVKLDALRAWLEERDLSAALLGSQANFAWITAGGHSHVSVGESGGVASILVTLEGAYLVTTNIELRRILDEELFGLPFEAVDYAWHRPEQRGVIVARLCDAGRAVCDLEGESMAQAAGELAKLRYVMLPPEVERYRALGKDAAEAVESACRSAESGDSELDVASQVAYECTRRNILPLVNLVAADERIARYRHPIPSGNQMRATFWSH